MTRKEKNVLTGAGLGFLAGVAMTGARYCAAATAPLSYPAIGAVSAAASAAGAMIVTRRETGLDLTNPAHACLATLGVTFATMAGAAWGTACIPTAVVEPVLAPLTAIPACTVGGVILASQ